MKTVVLAVMVSLMSVLVSIAVSAASAGYTPKYRVKVQADKHTDFSKVRTYSWMGGHPASIAALDAAIVAAIERELSALGMRQVPSGGGDVVVTYASVTRTDVNTKAKPISKDYRPEYAVGTLVVSLLDPASLRPLLQLRVDRPVDRDELDATIGGTIQELFTYFPTRRH
jgi:Domain of unknown function (DUF4136)